MLKKVIQHKKTTLIYSVSLIHYTSTYVHSLYVHSPLANNLLFDSLRFVFPPLPSLLIGFGVGYCIIIIIFVELYSSNTIKRGKSEEEDPRSELNFVEWGGEYFVSLIPLIHIYRVNNNSCPIIKDSQQDFWDTYVLHTW